MLQPNRAYSNMQLLVSGDNNKGILPTLSNNPKW